MSFCEFVSKIAYFLSKRSNKGHFNVTQRQKISPAVFSEFYDFE